MNLITETIQRNSVISFPFLGLTLNPPASFEIFGRTIYMYGVIIALGFMCGIFYCAHRAERFGLAEDDVYDVAIWLIPLSLIGARMYFVGFKLEYYLAHPKEIFAIWEGGIAIYGGIIGGIFAIYLVCRRKKKPFFAMIDLIAFGLLIGQIMGRWGNFMNREAFGGVTDVFCRMGLTNPNGMTIYVHPTFLYESLWNVGVFAFLAWFTAKGKRRYDGQNSLIYFFGYGLGRMWIEGLRTDSLYIGSTGIRVSQALSLVMVLVSGALLLRNGRKKFDEGALYVNCVKAAQESVIVPEKENENGRL